MSSTTSPALPHAVGPVSFQATAAPPDATEFNIATSPFSSPVGGIISLALTPAKGTWPSGTVLTPQATGVQGKFIPDTQRPIGVEPAYFQFVPLEPGTGTLTAVASFASVSSAPAAPTPAPTPAAATAFTTALSSSSGTVGNAVTLTVTPTGAAWPSSVVLTPSATGLSGTFAPTTRAPSGTAAATCAFTPSAAGSGTIDVVANPSMTTPAGLAYQATAAATPTPAPTPAPAPASDGTLAGLPATIVAGQPLSAATYGQSTPYFVLYRVSGAVEEGVRWASSVMPGALTLLIPQTAGAYTVRGYDAATAGNKVYESAQFSVTAAPGALPATPTQTADTGATSSSVTMNWTATGNNYRVLARPGPGSVYGSLADTTVSTNSYTFTGRPAFSTPRAVVIPQNANGYGTPTGQLISSTTA